MSEAPGTFGALAPNEPASAERVPAPAQAPAQARVGQRRRAFCPLCGREQTDKLASEVGSPEAALCVGRCTVGWQVLTALRVYESASELVAARRREERDAQQAPAPTLSEVLLERWRAGDWEIAPEDLIERLAAQPAP